MSLVATWILPELKTVEAASAGAMGVYLLFWGIFTLGMFVGTLKMNRALQVVFGSLTLLFLLLAIADFSGNHLIKTIAGFEGIICGMSALYAAIAQILNEIYGRKLMPLGTTKREAIITKYKAS